MLTTRLRSLTAIAAGALALTTALASCGSDDAAKDASAKTSAKTSASSTPSESSSTPTEDAASDDASAAAPGERLTTENLVPTMLAAMREKKTAHMAMEIGSSISADADVRYSGDKTDMKMSMDMGPQKAVVILVDGEMYMQQAAGSKYIKISKDTPGVGALLDQMSGLGPQSSISAMKGALKKVAYAGTETIDGDEVTKYEVTVDTSAMASTLGGPAGALGELPKTVTYSLYVDDEHLMRRIDMTVAGQRIVMTLSGWGEPVDIKAPPAFQVMSQ